MSQLKDDFTTLRERDDFIGFARGFSILTIVLFHFLRLVILPSGLSKAVLFGGTGIYIFLFASGYGLSLSKSHSWILFLRKRFSKILFPYYIGITLIFSVNLIVHIYPDGFKEYLGHILLYKMFIETYNRSFGGHFWFISTLIQLYLLFWPIIKLYDAFGGTKVLILATILSLTYSGVIIYWGKAEVSVWNRFALLYLWVFVLGIVAGRRQLLHRLKNLNNYYCIAAMVVGLAGAALMIIYGGKPGKLLNDYFAFIGYASVCIMAYRISKSIPKLAQIFTGIEAISYSWYIMHMLPITFYMQKINRTHLTPVEVPVLFAASILIAILFDVFTKWILATPGSK